MSITSLMRTLTATSIDGFSLVLLSLLVNLSTFGFGKQDSEQTAAITSCTSAGFSRKGCCSLFSKKIKILHIGKINTLNRITYVDNLFSENIGSGKLSSCYLD